MPRIGWPQSAAGAAEKTKRVTTGSVAAASSAEITVTWDAAFVDANYTVTVSVVEGTAATNTLRVNKIVSVAAESVVVRVENVDALVAHTGTLHAMARH